MFFGFFGFSINIPKDSKNYKKKEEIMKKLDSKISRFAIKNRQKFGPKSSKRRKNRPKIPNFFIQNRPKSVSKIDQN